MHFLLICKINSNRDIDFLDVQGQLIWIRSQLSEIQTHSLKDYARLSEKRSNQN